MNVIDILPFRKDGRHDHQEHCGENDHDRIHQEQGLIMADSHGADRPVGRQQPRTEHQRGNQPGQSRSAVVECAAERHCHRLVARSRQRHHFGCRGNGRRGECKTVNHHQGRDQYSRHRVPFADEKQGEIHQRISDVDAEKRILDSPAGDDPAGADRTEKEGAM